MTSNVVTITVPQALAITTHPKNYTGAVGTKAVFKVVAQGTGLSYQLQYYSGGKWNNFGSNRDRKSVV